MAKKHHPLVSIIIPVFNSEIYIQRCLDSIYSQTYDNYEIIAINDGSTDNSLNILKKNAASRGNFTVRTQRNHGQGFTRNKALEEARGEYVMFIDSDDTIQPRTLELTVEAAERQGSDIVHFDWQFIISRPGRPIKYSYRNRDLVSGKRKLIGPECDQLMRIMHYFSVNNLYRRSFLDDNHIRYADGKLYEDNVFIVKSANRAQVISMLPDILYNVQRNHSSSSRSRQGYRDDRHAVAFISAMSDCLAALEPRTQYSTYYLVKYFQRKFIFYYKRRVPLRHKYQFLKAYVDTLNGVTINIPDEGQSERIMRLCLKYHIFDQRRYGLFQAMILYKVTVVRVISLTKRLSKQAVRAIR